MRQKEGFSIPIDPTQPKVQFITVEETRALLRDDKDGYFASLTEADLRARKAVDLANYKQIADSVVIYPTWNEGDRIYMAIQQLRKVYLSPNGLKFMVAMGIDVSLFDSIPWKIALTFSDRYEEGFPHTRSDVIFLTQHFVRESLFYQLVKTMFHERVHIYQKAYPEKVSEWLLGAGFQKVGLRKKVHLIRANPDTDGILWKDPNGLTMRYTYFNNEPSGIEDVTLISKQTAEHPWEWMAYKLTSLLFDPPSDTDMALKAVDS